MDTNHVYRVGEVTVTRVPELILDSNTPEYLYPQWDPSFIQEHETWLVPGNMDKTCTHVFQSIHTWVLRTKQHTILIDTGAGNDKERIWIPRLNRLKSPYLERLKAAGVTPAMVDYVILTHLHVDHVGWNTQLVDGAWEPTFPNATYVFSKAEQRHYSDPENYPVNNRVKFSVYEDSVLPVIQAGQAEVIEPDEADFIEGISLYPVPGHSIGQMAVCLTSGGKEALFGGDVMHHPIQVYCPEWNSVYCEDAPQARASRRWALDYLADSHALFFSSHFAETSVGRVTRKGDRFVWQFC
ncbi:MAG TPA: MBL fold metallo-hydrolase [Methanosarcina sp.]|nr:MBL fold metallo-hydrolase [Methanosarcina sp.]